MFARMAVPCVAVVENMSFFDTDDGKRCAAHPSAALPIYAREHKAGLHGCSLGPRKRSGPVQHTSNCMQSFQELCLCVLLCHGSLCALRTRNPGGARFETHAGIIPSGRVRGRE